MTVTEIKTMKIANIKLLSKGREGCIGKVQRIFKSRKLFYITLYEIIYIILHFTTSIQNTTPKMCPIVNLGLWVMMTFKCGFFNCKKFTPRM
jgi:ABC-type uncharacterized transport system permease subunit